MKLLVAVRHPHGTNVPSCIPDWSQNLPLHLGYFYNESFSDTATEHCQKASLILRDEDSYSLELVSTGYKYAQIVRMSRIFSFSSLEDAEIRMRRLYASFHSLRKVLNREDEDVKIDTENNHIIYEHLGQSIVEDAFVVIEEKYIALKHITSHVNILCS